MAIRCSVAVLEHDQIGIAGQLRWLVWPVVSRCSTDRAALAGHRQLRQASRTHDEQLGCAVAGASLGGVGAQRSGTAAVGSPRGARQFSTLDVGGLIDGELLERELGQRELAGTDRLFHDRKIASLAARVQRRSRRDRRHRDASRPPREWPAPALPSAAVQRRSRGRRIAHVCCGAHAHRHCAIGIAGIASARRVLRREP